MASHRLADVDFDDLYGAAPWRAVRWHKGQLNYPGFYWSATERTHVMYESRLDLARLLFADFDTSIRHIAAQPFALCVELAGREHRHVPDYLLGTDGGPVVVDVKPRRRLGVPAVAFTHGWTRTAVESRGWRYEVLSEPPAVELGNVRFLAGYRRDWLFNGDLLDELRGADLMGATVDEAVRRFPARPRRLVRSALLHLLWRQELTIDLTRPLAPRTMLGPVPT